MNEKQKVLCGLATVLTLEELAQFVANLEEQGTTYQQNQYIATKDDDPWHTVWIQPQQRWILDSFSWRRTKEGHDYWEDISSRWRVALGHDPYI